MAQIKVDELSGSALDWAVAKAGGYVGIALEQRTGDWYNPSTDWAQGGPIIERERINVLIKYSCPGFEYSDNRRWHAYVDRARGFYYGPTPLIAAMRCYVAIKLGDVVEVPDELIK